MPQPNAKRGLKMAQVEAKKRQQVKVKVDYLPATEDMKRDYR